MAASQFDLGITGPSASYQGDPNDFQGSTGNGSNWNWNQFAGDLTGSLGGLFSGIGNLVLATKAQPPQYGQQNPNYPQTQNQNQNQQTTDWATIGIVGFIILVVLVMMFFLFKTVKN